MIDLDMEERQDEQGSEDPAVEPIEDPVVESIEGELTDAQLLQMAEGSCSWGANCNQHC